MKMTLLKNHQKMKSMLIAVGLIFIMVASVRAQGPDDLGSGEQQTPIDGGLSLLLAAGAAYGVNRMRKRKESK
jgi:hypothetical protein